MIWLAGRFVFLDLKSEVDLVVWGGIWIVKVVDDEKLQSLEEKWRLLKLRLEVRVGRLTCTLRSGQYEDWVWHWEFHSKMLSFIRFPAWSISRLLLFWDDFDYFCLCVAIDVVKSVWSFSVGFFGNLLSKRF